MTPVEEYELQKKIAAEEAAAAQSQAPPTTAATQWSLAGAMLSGIQSMGRAVQVSGDVVDRINLETQVALEKRVRPTSDRFQSIFPPTSTPFYSNPSKAVRIILSIWPV